MGEECRRRPQTSFRICQIHRDAPWYANLIKLEIRIASDHSSGRKVYAFPHEITAESPFFPFQAGTDCFDRTSGLLKSLWNACNIVIHVGGNVELNFSDECRIQGRNDVQTWRSCSNSVMTCAGAPSCSHLRTFAEALMISPSLYVRSSSLLIVPPSTAILGRTGGGGTGMTVRIIHSGRAYSSDKPRR